MGDNLREVLATRRSYTMRLSRLELDCKYLRQELKKRGIEGWNVLTGSLISSITLKTGF